MNTTQQITEVKPVKNSIFIQESSGDYVCLHYNTEIFRAGEDPEVAGTKIKTLYVPSVTSSEMAKRCYEYVFGRSPDAKEWKELKEELS